MNFTLYFDYHKIYIFSYFYNTMNKASIQEGSYTFLVKSYLKSEEFRSLDRQRVYEHKIEDFNNWSNYIDIIKKKFINGEMDPTAFNIAFNHNKDYIDDLIAHNVYQLYLIVLTIIFQMNEQYKGREIIGISINFFKFKKKINNIKNINSLKINKNISNIQTRRLEFNNKFLALTMDESKYGNKKYSTIREYVNNVHKIVVVDEKNFSKKMVYDLKTNDLLQTIFDTKITDNIFKRTIDNLSLTILNDKYIIQSEGQINLSYLKKNNKNCITFNKHIGTFDMETFSNKKLNKTQVYALGFSFLNESLDNSIVKTFYLKNNQTSNDLVIECIKEMLLTKYNKGIFYTHNLGGYDIIFMLKVLLEYNKLNNNYFKLKFIMKDNIIIKIEISAKISKTVKNKIILVDSLVLLPSSLESLGKDFNTNISKSYFPYAFMTEKTLNYIGCTPSIEFYHTIKKKFDQKLYDTIYSETWSAKEETLNYLKQDLLSLLEIMYKFNKNIFDLFNIEVTEVLTISSLAMEIMLKKHYKEKTISLINKKSMFYDIKQAYFGGMSDVYIPYGENLYYYDVNSLYPSSALNSLPGGNCSFIEDLTGQGLNLDNLFGFFYCKIITNKSNPILNYHPVVPYRTLGLLTQPNGEFYGWYFSENLKFAKQNGYDIQVIKGYKFDKINNIFDSYVDELYKLKASSTGTMRAIAKLLLNSLLGRFGMSIDKNITKLINKETYLNLIKTNKIFGEKWITEDYVLVTFDDSIDKELCELHGIDYFEILNLKKKDIEIAYKYKNVSIPIAAAITSYSNIFMSKIKLDILSKGGKIYYTDTDSIITNIKLSNNIIGDKLGQFKLEYEKIKRAYFIASKTYCLVTEDNVIIKAKGVNNNNLTEQDFINLYNNINIKAYKNQAKKYYEEGYVNLESILIDINSNRFKKREKIYKNGIWVDTKPLNISLNNSLIKIKD